MENLKPQIDDYDECFDNQITKPLTQANLFGKTLTRHWWDLLMITERGPVDHEHEYFILFLNKRTVKEIESD